jgi:hypothetical protein
MDALKPVLILLSGMAGAVLGFLLTASAIIFGFMALFGPEERADPFGGGGGIVLLGVFVGIIAAPSAGVLTGILMTRLLIKPTRQEHNLA